MIDRKKIGASVVFILVLVSGIFWFDPGRAIKEGMLLVTAVPVDGKPAADWGIDGKYIPAARILAIDPESPGKQPKLLTEDFYSARAPEVSYDGREMVFSAQKDAQDTWQVFIKDLETLEISQVTHCPVNCSDPVWLPDGRIGFSRLNDGEPGGSYHVIYACNRDGSGMERLSHHPGSDVSSTVIRDGRIIMISAQKYPSESAGKMMAMRIDGTKSELYYSNAGKKVPISRGWESSDGIFYFVEGDPGMPAGGKLVSVDEGHPLSSRVDLSPELTGKFHSVYPVSQEQLYVSYIEKEDDTYSLYTYDTRNRDVINKIYSDPEFHLIEPVAVNTRETPMKLPPVVDMNSDKGTLLCHNSDLTMPGTVHSPGKDGGPEKMKTSKVQVFGLDGLLGEVEVEEDGSFYIEIDADKPVRFRTLNAQGEVLRGPSSWIWVRPNEKRSCIGCHEDRELAPENRVPDALYNGMVSLPEGEKSEPIVLSDKYEKL